MPRPNPETRTTTISATYVAGNGYTNNVSRTEKSFERSYTSVNTPGYPKAIKENPHEVRVTTYNHSTFTTNRRKVGGQPWDWDTWTDSVSQLGLPSDSFNVWDCSMSSASEQMAINRAMDSVADASINLAQAFAERAQTSSLILDTASRLARAMVAVKRRDGAGAARALGLGKPRKMSGNVANDWLALQYGWLPLLSDVHGAAELLAKKNTAQPPLIIGRGTGRDSLDNQSRTFDAADIGSFKMDLTDQQISSKCVLRFKVTNELLRTGHQTGITNPLLLGWELVPYSFVVDWFLPVGDFLGRLNYDSGLEFHSGYLVSKATSQGTVSASSAKVFSGVMCTPSGQPLTCENVWVKRVPFQIAPRPTLPSFKDPFSATHVANAVALLRSAFR